jgi:peptide/nickel transport system permease protein
MIGYVSRRLLAAIPVLIGISVISFIIIKLSPGDFATSYKQQLIELGGMGEAEAERASNEFRAAYGLDKPAPIQYLTWVQGIVTRGSFGNWTLATTLKTKALRARVRAHGTNLSCEWHERKRGGER